MKFARDGQDELEQREFYDKIVSLRSRHNLAFTNNPAAASSRGRAGAGAKCP